MCIQTSHESDASEFLSIGLRTIICWALPHLQTALHLQGRENMSFGHLQIIDTGPSSHSSNDSQQSKPKHLAQLRDGSLQELLVEALLIAEIRFSNFDSDSAGVIMYRELRRSLGHAGFHDEKKLQVHVLL